MRKSAVLKDMKNHTAGYMLVCEDGVRLKTQLDVPSQLAVALSDGAVSVFSLEGGRQEQRFSCDGTQVTGCCVFRGNQLLLVSDESMRCIFERQAFRPEKKPERLQESEPTPEKAQREHTQIKRKDERKLDQNALVLSRWPPPPCWETAVYRNGRWQEEKDAAGMAAQNSHR